MFLIFRRLSLVCLFLLFNLIMASVRRTGDDVSSVNAIRRFLFDKNSLPRLSDIDMIELYHLRSFPHLAIVSDSGSFSIQTSGSIY